MNDMMVNELVKEDKITQDRVEQAFRKVKRHHFLKGIVDPEEAYEDRPIMIKGRVSSSSQPYVMAMMLEELDLKKDHKVLEIGTASGYNAALLSEVVGSDQLVYSIEIEGDLAQRAGKLLKEAGYSGVTVIAGDGRKGYPVSAPYDRIIVTAEGKTIYNNLLKQLASDGILLIPFNFYGAITVTVKLSQIDEDIYRGPLVGFPVNFVPIRGVDLDKLEDSEHKEIVSCYNMLKKQLSVSNLFLDNDEMIGLVLLMISRYKETDHLDYRQLIDDFKKGGLPGIDGFEFEYDKKKEDWKLIPQF